MTLKNDWVANDDYTADDANDVANEVNAATAAIAGKADSSALSAHTGNTSNPHSVTKSQVGLGNVTNNAQYYPGGADVAVADGGTGVSTLTGVVKGNGTLPFSTAVAGTDYVAPSGALGTPSSGTLTNCTGLPLAGVTDSTSEALGVGSLEVGHASDTTVTRSAAGVIAVEGKRVATVDSATVSNDTTLDIVPVCDRTYAEDTGLTGAVTVTAQAGQVGWFLFVSLVGTAARAITWDSGDFEVGPQTLPTTTVTTERLDTLFVWNTATSKWRCLSSGSA